jgi:lipoate-protein ligase A
MLKGCKIAGAGQRRSRAGLLHQGSLQIGTPDFPQAQNFAGLLAPLVQRTTLPKELIERAMELNQNSTHHPSFYERTA